MPDPEHINIVCFVFFILILVWVGYNGYRLRMYFKLRRSVVERRYYQYHYKDLVSTSLKQKVLDDVRMGAGQAIQIVPITPLRFYLRQKEISLKKLPNPSSNDRASAAQAPATNSGERANVYEGRPPFATAPVATPTGASPGVGGFGLVGFSGPSLWMGFNVLVHKATHARSIAASALFAVGTIDLLQELWSSLSVPKAEDGTSGSATAGAPGPSSPSGGRRMWGGLVKYMPRLLMPTSRRVSTHQRERSWGGWKEATPTKTLLKPDGYSRTKSEGLLSVESASSSDIPASKLPRAYEGPFRHQRTLSSQLATLGVGGQSGTMVRTGAGENTAPSGYESGGGGQSEGPHDSPALSQSSAPTNQQTAGGGRALEVQLPRRRAARGSLTIDVPPFTTFGGLTPRQSPTHRAPPREPQTPLEDGVRRGFYADTPDSISLSMAGGKMTTLSLESQGTLPTPQGLTCPQPAMPPFYRCVAFANPLFEEQLQQLEDLAEMGMGDASLVGFDMSPREAAAEDQHRGNNSQDGGEQEEGERFRCVSDTTIPIVVVVEELPPVIPSKRLGLIYTSTISAATVSNMMSSTTGECEEPVFELQLTFLKNGSDLFRLYPIYNASTEGDVRQAPHKFGGVEGIPILCGGGKNFDFENIYASPVSTNEFNSGAIGSGSVSVSHRAAPVHSRTFSVESSASTVSLGQYGLSGVAPNGAKGAPDNDGGDDDESDMCIICYSALKAVITMPCAHYAVCMDCIKKLKECPLCRKPITETLFLLRPVDPPGGAKAPQVPSPRPEFDVLGGPKEGDNRPAAANSGEPNFTAIDGIPPTGNFSADSGGMAGMNASLSTRAPSPRSQTDNASPRCRSRSRQPEAVPKAKNSGSPDPLSDRVSEEEYVRQLLHRLQGRSMGDTSILGGSHSLHGEHSPPPLAQFGLDDTVRDLIGALRGRLRRVGSRDADSFRGSPVMPGHAGGATPPYQSSFLPLDGNILSATVEPQVARLVLDLGGSGPLVADTGLGAALNMNAVADDDADEVEMEVLERTRRLSEHGTPAERSLAEPTGQTGVPSPRDAVGADNGAPSHQRVPSTASVLMRSFSDDFIGAGGGGGNPSSSTVVIHELRSTSSAGVGNDSITPSGRANGRDDNAPTADELSYASARSSDEPCPETFTGKASFATVVSDTVTEGGGGAVTFGGRDLFPEPVLPRPVVDGRDDDDDLYSSLSDGEEPLSSLAATPPSALSDQTAGRGSQAATPHSAVSPRDLISPPSPPSNVTVPTAAPSPHEGTGRRVQ